MQVAAAQDGGREDFNAVVLMEHQRDFQARGKLHPIARDFQFLDLAHVHAVHKDVIAFAQAQHVVEHGCDFIAGLEDVLLAEDDGEEPQRQQHHEHEGPNGDLH